MSGQMDQLFSILSGTGDIHNSLLRDMEEIRITKGRKIRLCKGHQEQELPCIVDGDLIQDVLDRSTDRSPHSYMEMMGKGFLILPGGHRLGICGTGVYRDGVLRTLRDISSINIRIARDIHDIGIPVADALWRAPGSALCIGPPGRGKTTLLRDIIRQLSCRYREIIGVIDERLELAACLDGYPQFDLGPTTDIMSSVRKAEAMEMMIRTTRPTWIALDEITAEEDVDAIIRGSYCGVRFLATAHGEGVNDLKTRPIYRRLLDSRVFHHFFVIASDRSIREEPLWNYSVS